MPIQHRNTQIHTDTLQIQRLKLRLTILWALTVMLLFFKKRVCSAKMTTKPNNPNKLDSQ